MVDGTSLSAFCVRDRTFCIKTEVNLVVLYDNVPSSIRFVQRRGTNGKKGYWPQAMVVLIANKTIDEAYYWIGQRKVNLVVLYDNDRGRGRKDTGRLVVLIANKTIKHVLEAWVKRW